MVVSPSRLRRLSGLLAVFAFLAFMAGQSPHLVHHLFDHHDVEVQDCPLAAAGDRLPILQADPATLAFALALLVGLEPPAIGAASHVVVPGNARSPPPSAS